jgi:GGDEF domain-containing protein
MDFAGRVGGDEFIVVFPETGENEVEAIVKKFRGIKNASIGYCQYNSSIEKTMSIAEKMMQEEKKRRKGEEAR